MLYYIRNQTKGVVTMKYVASLRYYTVRAAQAHDGKPHIIMYKVFTDEQAAWDYINSQEHDYYNPEGRWYNAYSIDAGYTYGDVDEFDDDDTDEQIKRYLTYGNPKATLWFDND